MAAHWSIAQIDNHQSVSHSVRYVCIELQWQLKTWHIHTGSSRRKCKSIGGVRQFGTRTIWHQDSKSGHFGTKKANRKSCNKIRKQTIQQRAIQHRTIWQQHSIIHRKNCKSYQSQVTWKVKFKCQFCPVPFRLSCPVLSCPVLSTRTNMSTMSVATMMTMATMRKLEVIW